jgi:Mg-chelatase subunit ChlD
MASELAGRIILHASNMAIFVKNLDVNVDEDCVRSVFGVYGSITSAQLERRPDGISMGFGVVRFSQSAHASAALAANGQVILGRAIAVTLYNAAAPPVIAAAAAAAAAGSAGSSPVPGAPVAPAAPNPQPLTLTLASELDRVNPASAASRVLLTLRSPSLDAATRTPLNLMLCVDISSSMRESMALLRDTLAFLVNNVTAHDHLGIVTFHSTVDVLLPMTRMTPAHKVVALARIAGLRQHSGTNLSGGLFKGCNLLADILYTDSDEARPIQASAVFLMTDGEANEGLHSRRAILQVINDRSFAEAGSIAAVHRDRERSRSRSHSPALEPGVAPAGQALRPRAQSHTPPPLAPENPLPLYDHPFLSPGIFA